MQLNKFGAILKFAIELEQKAAEFYETAAQAAPSQELEESAAAARKRLSRLKVMQRELVNEMLLEPIAGFDQPALPELAVGSTSPERIQRQKAQIEQAARQFYTIASDKLGTVAPGVSRAFKKMAAQV